MSRTITSFDVARLAGVSQATVSRALRNLPNISPATREKVARAAAELNYVPHGSARSLSTRITSRVAIVSEELTNPFYPALVEPLRQHLSDNGYRTMLVTDDEDDALTASNLTDGSCDGVIITTAARNSRLPDALRAAGLPCVLVNRTTDSDRDVACQFANAAGAGHVAELLTELGHEHIGLINGPETISTSAERERGLKDALEQAGRWLPSRLIRHGDFTAEAGRRGALDLLDAPVRPTALVCGNDYIAIGALNAAKELGLSVPEDLTVIGFDDVAMASWELIDLTTVHCDLSALAWDAVDSLLRLIGDRPADCLRVTAVDLVLRGTHAAPRRG
ncbi:MULTISPECIES: LacI family DNA-binding transcriptional regulator [unclassified Brevibacterium]|nr:MULTISPECIES: LacI family DNA-binding transcriptional regulator [unclassified Brevibacterium]MCM1011195.1 LacI family transcriptional regulator [Brevibacterium sp. XM4083]